MAHKISIVIPHYVLDNDIFALAKRNVRSIRKYTETPYELVMVDNASPMGGDWIADVADVLVKNDENRGNPGGWNDGLKAATGDIVCFMDNDVQVTRGWDAPLVRLLEDEETGVAFPMSWNRDEPSYNEKLAGFCWMVRRDLANEIGGFNEEYGLGNFEDTSFFCEARLRGKKLLCSRDSKVRHYSRATTDKIPEVQEAYDRNEKIHFDKYGFFPLLD